MKYQPFNKIQCFKMFNEEKALTVSQEYNDYELQLTFPSGGSLSNPDVKRELNSFKKNNNNRLNHFVDSKLDHLNKQLKLHVLPIVESA